MKPSDIDRKIEDMRRLRCIHCGQLVGEYGGNFEGAAWTIDMFGLPEHIHGYSEDPYYLHYYPALSFYVNNGVTRKERKQNRKLRQRLAKKKK